LCDAFLHTVATSRKHTVYPSTPARFDIFPALHLRGGRLIDLAPGSAGPIDTALDERDPIAMAMHWIEQGATRLHIVNVDAAFDEDATHGWSLLEALCALPVKVQYGGGLRTGDAIRWAMRAGVDRVLLGTAAVESPQLVSDAIAEHGREHIGLAIMTDETGDVVTHGTRASGGLHALALAVQMKGLGIGEAMHMRLEPDGSMTGTDLHASRELASLSGLDIVVGGEVRDMEDVVACYNQPGITGVLIGKALQSGAIDLRVALSETRATLAFENGLSRWKEEQTTLRLRLRHALSHRFLDEHLPSPMASSTDYRVLDAGGGAGTDSLPLAARGARVDLVDRSRPMMATFLDAAAALGAAARVAIHQRDIREIPRRFPEPTFDLVLAHGVIQYSDDWEKLLEAMIAPLKPGGLLSLITRNLHAQPYALSLDEHTADELPDLLERTRGPSAVFDTDVRYFSAAWLGEWLDGHGLDVVGNRGLVCRHTLPQTVTADELASRLEQLVALESVMGSRSPYRETAEHVHLVARRR